MGDAAGSLPGRCSAAVGSPLGQAEVGRANEGFGLKVWRSPRAYSEFGNNRSVLIVCSVARGGLSDHLCFYEIVVRHRNHWAQSSRCHIFIHAEPLAHAQWATAYTPWPALFADLNLAPTHRQPAHSHRGVAHTHRELAHLHCEMALLAVIWRTRTVTWRMRTVTWRIRTVTKRNI